MKSVVLAICALLLAGNCSLPQAQQGGAYGPGYAVPPGGFSINRGVRFERLRDPSGYILRIHIRGYSPGAIQVKAQGRSLVVENRESQQIEQRDERGGYRFASSSSNLRRRFSLPPDANLAAMQRNEEEGMIVITIPYAGGPRN